MRSNVSQYELVAPGSLSAVLALLAAEPGAWTPMAGGTDLKNIFREDTERENTNQGAGVEAFPEKEKGYLKVPPVFE